MVEQQTQTWERVECVSGGMWFTLTEDREYQIIQERPGYFTIWSGPRGTTAMKMIGRANGTTAQVQGYVETTFISA